VSKTSLDEILNYLRPLTLRVVILEGNKAFEHARNKMPTVEVFKRIVIDKLGKRPISERSTSGVRLYERLESSHLLDVVLSESVLDEIRTYLFSLDRGARWRFRVKGPFCFRAIGIRKGTKRALKTVWRKTLRRSKISNFRIYDLRSMNATRLSAGGVADEWVTQMLRQSDAQVFKKYSQMKLQMKREALEKLNRRANEIAPIAADVMAFSTAPTCTVTVQ
jgi:integrase